MRKLGFLATIFFWSTSAFAGYDVFQKPTQWNMDLNDRYGQYKEYANHPDSLRNMLKDCDFNQMCDGTKKGSYHTAIDYEKDGGEEIIRASNHGQVAFYSVNGYEDHGMGNVVILEHYCENSQDCPPYGMIYSLYAHLNTIDADVFRAYNNRGTSAGWIQKGQQIGIIGGSANGYTYVDYNNDPDGNKGWLRHLHFEMKAVPMLGSPYCKTLDMQLAWPPFKWKPYYGYTNIGADKCGYFDPNDYIGLVSAYNPYTDGAVSLDDDTTVPDGFPGGVFGSGTTTSPIDSPDPGEPDFIVTRMWLETVGGVEQYTYNVGQEIKMKAQFKNVGDADSPDDIEVRFYLSDGYKEDLHSERVHVGTDNINASNMQVGDTQTETEGLITLNEPGKVYNIVACADTQSDVTEKHESNNCSTEAVFQINGTFDFIVTNAALGGGKTSLTVNEVFSVDTVSQNVQNDVPRDIRIGYYIYGEQLGPDSVLIGTDSIKEENFTSGVTKHETLSSAYAPKMEGMYIITACVDYDNRVEENNESNNCFSFDVFVDDPDLASGSAEGTGQSPNYMGNATKEVIMGD